MSWTGILATTLVLAGLVTLTISVLGALRLPTTYLRLHAAGKSVVFGVVLILAGSIGTAEPAIVARAAVVAIILLLTAPTSAHIIGRGIYRRSDAPESLRRGEDG